MEFLFQGFPLKLAIRAAIMCLLLFGAFLGRNFSKRPLSAEMRKVLGFSSEPRMITISDSQRTSLHDGKLLKDFYLHNDYEPVWLSANQPIFSQNTYALISRISRSYLDGLDPKDYHSEEIRALVGLLHSKAPSSMDNATIALLDILLTDAYVTYTTDMYAGRVSSAHFNENLLQHRNEIRPLDSLAKIKKGAGMEEILDAFTCPYTPYRQLKGCLEVCYRTADPASPQTLARIRCITLNMERWRWLHRPVPDLYVMANLADFSLKLADRGRDTLSMKTIAGKLRQPTPLFQAKLAYLVLNPWWEVPSAIVRAEIIPEMKKNRSYLANHHMKVYKDAVELKEGELNWDTVTPGNFHYRLRQTPGPWNALGAVKFIFPNKYGIYFHDTPNPELFENNVRTFSHGCIRIEKPIRLAAFLLKRDADWVTKKIESKAERRLKIEPGIPVNICYWTGWIDESGELRQVPDVYGYDTELAELLELAPLEVAEPHRQVAYSRPGFPALVAKRTPSNN